MMKRDNFEGADMAVTVCAKDGSVMGKSKKILAGAALCGFMMAGLSCSSPSVTVRQMRCEYQENPIGIDIAHPRFTWTYEGDSTWRQGSYKLVLARSEKDLRHHRNVWESAVTASSQMRARYTGETSLEPHTTYYWQVEAWNADGKRKVCSPAGRFETAKMEAEDWKACWISDGRPMDEHTAPLVRRRFEVEDGLQQARLYVSAAAYAQLEVNGQPSASTSLNPGYTHYDRRNLYNVYDITSLLSKGENEIRAVLGNGFYNEIDRLGVWDFERARWRGRPRLLCELRLTYKDRVETVASDASWQAKPSPFLFNDIYSGVIYDARLDKEDETPWSPCVVVEAPSPLLKAQQMGGVEVDRVYRPVSLRSIGDSIYVADFGTNMSGYARLRLQGKAGTRIHVRHGEELGGDGLLDVHRISIFFDKGKGYDFQTDVYTLSGKVDTLVPAFTYHGFRYAEIHVHPAMKIEEKDLEALFVHTALRPVGSFRCSDDTLNLIWKAVNQSYLSNFVSIPTDCPQREKNGWTADAHISSDIGLLNFDPFTAYEKWLDDMQDNQLESGQIADIIPSSGWGFSVNPVWSAVLAVISRNLYLYSGDLDPVRKALPLCENYLRFLQANEADWGGIAVGLGDWVPYETRTPEEFTSTCYYYLLNDYTARFRRLLGQDAAPYEAKAQQLKDLLNRRYFDKETRLYSTGSQAAQGTALFVGIVPEERAQELADRLSEMIRRCGNHLDFGMLGTKTVLRMLTRYGYVDQALEMALQQEAPSWAAWIADGLTTLPEEWVLAGGTSLNHVFLGDINAWMYNALAGINYDPENPGFRNILIEPHFPKRLQWAEASYDSVSGPVFSRWERQADGIRLQVSIPVNCTAIVRLGGEEISVGAGRHTFTVGQ